MQGSLSARLGAFAAETSLGSVPASAIEAVRACLLHDLIIALAGRPHERVIQRLAETAWRYPEEATLLSSGLRIGAEGAAFANAALMNVRSQDDTHEPSVSHPGVPAICAGLAAAQLARPTGREFLAALVLGYEMTGRIGRHCASAMSARGFRAAAALGVFGAAAAAARLLGLDAAKTAHALGLATQMAGGHGQVWAEGGSEFTTQIGLAARNGLVAARLAQAGATAVPHAFEGKSGFFRAFAASEVDADAVTAGLGRSWAVEEVTVKLHPVCAVLQGPVQLARELLAGRDFEAGEVAFARLTLSPFEAGYPGIDNAHDIRTASAAKMSAQFSLALALRDGAVSFPALAQVDDPAARALAGRIEVLGDAGLAPRQCRLEIGFSGGEVVSGGVDAPVGQPDRAASLRLGEELAAEAGVSRGELYRLAAAVDGLGEAESLDPLLAAWPGRSK